jgi:hypothetical protein
MSSSCWSVLSLASFDSSVFGRPLATLTLLLLGLLFLREYCSALRAPLIAVRLVLPPVAREVQFVRMPATNLVL